MKNSEKTIAEKNTAVKKTRSVKSWDDLVSYFWKYVHRKGENDCWVYFGSLDSRGYGRIHSKNFGAIKAHRLSWIIHHGQIAPHQFVCHRCDNPPCVNPAHHFIGTNSENFKDMWAKGRGNVSKGEDHPQCKLSLSDVSEIRLLWNSNMLNQMRLSEKFGVTQSHISLIVRGLAR